MSLASNATNVQGNTDTLTTDVGYPIKVGGVYNSAAPAPTSGQRVDFQMDAAGRLNVSPCVISTGVDGVVNANGARVVSGSSLLQLDIRNYLYNGTAWDMQRNNMDNITVLASAARTAQIQSADQTNNNGRGVQVTLNVTAASGTGGLTLEILGKDPVSGSYFPLNADPTAVIATGTLVYELYPGEGAAAGGITQRTSAPLPRTWAVKVKVGDSSSYTYSVAASVIL